MGFGPSLPLFGKNWWFLLWRNQGTAQSSKLVCVGGQKGRLDAHASLQHSLLPAWAGTSCTLSRYLNVPPQCARWWPSSYGCYLHWASSHLHISILLFHVFKSRPVFQLVPLWRYKYDPVRSIWLQSEAASGQDRLLLSLSLFSIVNKSNLNLLSLNIFSEKLHCWIHSITPVYKKQRKNDKERFLSFFFYCFFSEIFHMQMLMLCQVHDKQLSFCRCKEIEYLRKWQRVGTNERSFSITCKVTENKDIHEPSKTECKAMRLYLL